MEMTYASDEFKSQPDTDALRHSKITSISYVYTAYHKGDFSQERLNQQRWKTLWSILPDVEIDKIERKEIAQTACMERSCAQSLFHGFVVTYEVDLVMHSTQLQKSFGNGHSSQKFELTTSQGTMLSVEPSSFQYTDGTPHTGHFSLFIREALSMEDIVMGGLITDCEEGILSSGGMLEIQVNAGGRPLELRENKRISLEVPTANVDKEMNLYRGSTDIDRISWSDPQPLKPLENKNCTPVVRSMDSPKNYTVIDKLEWEQCEGINWLRLTKLNQTIKFYPDNFTMQLAIDYGLGISRYSTMKEWFEQGRVDSIQVNSIFWGERLGIEGNGIIDSVAVAVGRNEKIQMYSLEAPFLGWINIDKLLKYEQLVQKKSPIASVIQGDASGVKTVLVIPELKVTLLGFAAEDEQTYRYRPFSSNVVRHLPDGLDVLLLAIKEKGDGQVGLDIERTRIGQEEKIDLMLVDRDKEAIKAQLVKHLYP